MSISAVISKTEATPACPISKSQNTQWLCKVDGFDVWRCPDCATDFVWPMPDEKSLQRFYDRPIWFEGGEKGGYQDYDKQTEAVLPLFQDLLGRHEMKSGDASILDIGCGYGTHLALAAEKGWKCFGIEISSHARQIAHERHGSSVYVVDRIERLVPHKFDLILLFDVLEHLTDPYQFFFKLFSKGAITPTTRIAITTPNARSSDAMADPGGWIYRHPPSHLVYYSGESLQTLLKKMRFSHITVSGNYALAEIKDASYKDESSELNHKLRSYAGLICEAVGSDFETFMHERYVPGTWSKIAEYEHLPRYCFAQQFAKGARVLDFGCGVGYGAAMLADTAQSVIGVDIDEAALHWARQTHRNSNLVFDQRGDLGAGLQAGSFDLITCFEMIEHVNEETQHQLLRSLARLLRPIGVLVISTPNPDVTANYGENPFHLHEMSEQEFAANLNSHFRFVQVFKQWIRPSVTIAKSCKPADGVVFHDFYGESEHFNSQNLPVNYVAICSNHTLPSPSTFCFFDSSFDYIADTVSLQNSLNQIQGEAVGQWEVASDRMRHIRMLQGEISNYQEEIHDYQKNVAQMKELTVVHIAMIHERDAQILAFQQSKIYRLRDAIKNGPFSIRKFTRIFYLLTAMALPSRMRIFLRSSIQRIKPRPMSERNAIQPYQIQVPQPQNENRPRVVHAIANFMTGGSSRLVVDLVEHMGHIYEQEILTGYLPSPLAYIGVPTHLFQGEAAAGVIEYLGRFRPALLHAHYWGDCDQEWYEQVFRAAKKYGCRIIENVNTPIKPHFCDSIERYIYVSDYVWNAFGQPDRSHVRIYPGTNFRHFERPAMNPPEDCIGMVYRLETDKLRVESIDTFLEVVRRRPRTKVLIVGGGSLLEIYKKKVQAAGFSEAFQFTGYASYQALPSLYRKMSVFVAPVWKESFGQVTPMAMSLQLPVVGYDVGALSEILGSKEWLAPPGDSRRLADLIIELLEDRKRRVSIGKGNRERARSLFSLEKMIAAYENLYAELLEPSS